MLKEECATLMHHYLIRPRLKVLGRMRLALYMQLAWKIMIKEMLKEGKSYVITEVHIFVLAGRFLRQHTTRSAFVV